MPLQHSRQDPGERRGWLQFTATVLVAIVAIWALAACGGTTPSPEPSEPSQAMATDAPEPEPSDTPETAPTAAQPIPGDTPESTATSKPTPLPRLGAWLDTLIAVEEPSPELGVARLETGDLDIYAGMVADSAVLNTVKTNPDLRYTESVATYNEILFNPVGPTLEGTGALNPFSVPRIREAMNWLVDRDYLVDELLGGLGRPRVLPITSAFPDYARYAGLARELEAKYAHDPERAQAIIGQEMEALGAERVDGAWHYGGKPVELVALIRTEDERREVGDYLANLLEDMGFAVDRQYKTATEAGPIWLSGDPSKGLWHFYTGAWVTTKILRDEGSNFDFFYTPRGLPSPTWQAFQPSPELDDVASRLNRRDYATMEERADLYAQALRLSVENSQRIWLVDRTSFTPRRKEVAVTADLAGGIAGSWLAPYTLRREGKEGGSMTLGMPVLLGGPWNPLAGVIGLMDSMLVRATGDWAVVFDPFTGLNLPQRLDSAEVYPQRGLPVTRSLDWVSLEFVRENVVPDDAWAGWDAAEQRFLSAAEVYTQTVTAKVKVVCRYPSELYETAWHDGSTFSLGDLVMAMILQFDRTQEESPIFDAAAVPVAEPFLRSFKGWRIAQQDPLVIEHYTDQYDLDAENSVTERACAYPQYDHGHGAWHMMAIGILAEAAGELAFSPDKADALEVEWLSYIDGPSLEILGQTLEQAAATTYIPYEATLGQYITAEEAQTRWANYKSWIGTYGHFWIGNGPYYLERVFPVERLVILQRFEGYPDPAERWQGYAEPRIAEVAVEGPGQVAIGSEASYDVRIAFAGDAYPLADIAGVHYLVFGASDELAFSGAAEPAQDGLYRITLGEEQTAELEAGTNRLEVIVSPLVVSIPTFESTEFVTSP
jgi:peptide/nickel transport system substrate-binding protein